MENWSFERKTNSFLSFISTIPLPDSTTVWLMKSLPFRSFNNICRKADLSESCSQMQIIWNISNTDESRIGMFHEIGQQAATMQRQPDWIWNWSWLLSIHAIKKPSWRKLWISFLRKTLNCFVFIFPAICPSKKTAKKHFCIRIPFSTGWTRFIKKADTTRENFRMLCDYIWH